MSRIEAMRSQEEHTRRSHNYFSKLQPVDEACRKAMADWCFKLVDALSLSRESVSIAMSYLDRYLSSGKGKSSEALENRHKFQLAAITTFYIAVKLNEEVEVGVDLLVRLCRGFYSETDILSMERDILFSLEWRVSGPTPLDFVKHLLELLPESARASYLDQLLQVSQLHMDYATSELYFSSCKPSVVGAGCVMSTLSETDILTSIELSEFCKRISKALDFDVQTSTHVLEVQQRLLLQSSHCIPFVVSKVSTLIRSNSSVSTYSMDGGSSSPVCVSLASR